MRSKFHRHCSDERLLAYLDGELSLPVAGRVRRHLDSCWHCRNRLGTLEEQARAVAAAFERQTYPGSRHIMDARDRFLADVDLAECVGSPEPTFLVSEFRRSRASLVFAVAAACGALAYFAYSPSREALDPQNLLHVAQAREASQFRLPMSFHQEFAVEIEQSEPKRPPRSSRLRVWREGGGQRFAARWEGQGGELKYAAWQPAPGEEREFEPSESPGIVARRHRSPSQPLLRILRSSGGSVQEIEHAFFQWLRQREWTLVSLSSEFAWFAAEEGVVLHAERLSAAEGNHIRLTAERDEDDLRLELVLELEVESLRPRLQTARISSADQQYEFRLASRRSTVSASAINASFFRPQSPAIPQVLNRPHGSMDAHPPASLSMAPSQLDLDTKEVEILYALHRARLCLGEPVEVARLDGRGLRVDAIVEATDRRDEILAVLKGVSGSPFVEVRVRTTDEEPGLSVGAGELPAIRFTTRDLPIQELLERGLGGQAGRSDLRAEVARLSHSAMLLAEGALAEAWAIRDVSVRFPGRSVQKLRPQTRWLLEVMLRDHVTALSGQVREVRSSLHTILAATPSHGNEVQPVESRAVQSKDYLALFEVAKDLHSLLSAAFAGNEMPAGVSAEELLVLISVSLDTVEAQAQTLTAHLAWRPPEPAEDAQPDGRSERSRIQ